jgi:hypothetical protein
MFTHRGGAMLGKGVHGCTFDPAPRCAGGSVFRTVDGKPTVGKITDEDIRDELAIGRAIMELDDASEYFALPSIGCRPAERYEDPDARRCNVITESGESTRLSMLIMPDAGVRLSKWADADLPRLVKNYVRMFVHLLEGMIIYQQAGYVHNDIHMANILVDDHDVARFIDFGLAFRPEEIKSWSDTNLNRRFSPKHMLQAPEIHAWRMYLNGVRLSDGIRQLTDANEDYEKLAAQFPSRKTLERAFTELLQTEYVRDEKIGEFMKRYGYGIDCWRIGLCFWWMWRDILEWPGFRNTDLWQDRDIIRRVLSGLTDFDYSTRMSAREALTLLNPSNWILKPVSSAGGSSS